MKETKDNNQKLYKVRIYKDFEFPSFVIDSNNTLEDLYIKSIGEVEDSFHKHEGYFEVEVEQVLPFSLEKEKEIPIRRDLRFFIREVAVKDVEDKYGKLDWKTNPDIYDKRTKNDGSGIDQNSPYYIKNDVENFYLERAKYYADIFLNKQY